MIRLLLIKQSRVFKELRQSRVFKELRDINKREQIKDINKREKPTKKAFQINSYR